MLWGRLVLKFLAEAGVAVISLASGQQITYEHYINSNGRKLKIRDVAGKYKKK